MTRVKSHQASFLDIKANVLSAFMYGFICLSGFIYMLNYWAFVFPLIVYGVEKKSQYVKKNALQAFVISFVAAIIYFILMMISDLAKPWCNEALTRCYGSAIIHRAFSIYGSIRWLLAGFIFVICLILAIRSYNYEDYNLECTSKIVEKLGKFFDKILGSSNNIKEDITDNNKKKKPKKVKKEEKNISE